MPPARTAGPPAPRGPPPDPRARRGTAPPRRRRPLPAGRPAPSAPGAPRAADADGSRPPRGSPPASTSSATTRARSPAGPRSPASSSAPARAARHSRTCACTPRPRCCSQRAPQRADRTRAPPSATCTSPSTERGVGRGGGHLAAARGRHRGVRRRPRRRRPRRRRARRARGRTARRRRSSPARSARRAAPSARAAPLAVARSPVSRAASPSRSRVETTPSASSSSSVSARVSRPVRSASSRRPCSIAIDTRFPSTMPWRIRCPVDTKIASASSLARRAASRRPVSRCRAASCPVASASPSRSAAVAEAGDRPTEHLGRHLLLVQVGGHDAEQALGLGDVARRPDLLGARQHPVQVLAGRQVVAAERQAAAGQDERLHLDVVPPGLPRRARSPPRPPVPRRRSRSGRTATGPARAAACACLPGSSPAACGSRSSDLALGLPGAGAVQHLLLLEQHLEPQSRRRRPAPARPPARSSASAWSPAYARAACRPAGSSHGGRRGVLARLQQVVRDGARVLVGAAGCAHRLLHPPGGQRVVPAPARAAAGRRRRRRAAARAGRRTRGCARRRRSAAGARPRAREPLVGVGRAPRGAGRGRAEPLDREVPEHPADHAGAVDDLALVRCSSESSRACSTPRSVPGTAARRPRRPRTVQPSAAGADDALVDQPGRPAPR